MTKWFKQISALVVTLLILFNLTSVFSQTQTSDYSQNWAHQEISKWLSYGIIQTDENGDFRPSDSISRADMAVLLNKVFNYLEESDIEFSDVTTDMPFAKDIALAVEAGNFTGDRGRFRPNDPISRQEAALVFVRAFDIQSNQKNSLSKFADAGKIASWSKDAVNAVVGCGYMVGLPGNIFAPTKDITRAEAVKMIDNIIGDLKNKAGTYTGDVDGNLVVNTDNVILKDMTIHGDLYLTEGIGDGDVRLDNVKIAGRAIVKGGGENSIILHNTALSGSLIIIKKDGKVRVVASGNTEIENTILNSGGRLVESKLTGNGFNGVEVIRVAVGQQIILDGDFVNLDIQADDVNAEIVDGAVGTINVGEGTSKTDIVIGDTASVANLVADSEVMVKGSSRIENAQINTNDVVLDARPRELNIGDDISVMIKGVKINNPPKVDKTPPDTTPSPEPTPVQTTAGGLSITPKTATIETTRDLHLHYSPGERTANGTVVFCLPDEITATTEDFCYIVSESLFELKAENISDSGKTVTVKGLNLRTNPYTDYSFTLWLKDKKMPANIGPVSFSAYCDSDGDRDRKLPSVQTSSSLNIVSTISDLRGYASYYADSISLQWTAPSGAKLVELQYKLSSEEWEEAKTVELGTEAEAHSLSGVAADTTYDIRLVVEGGENAGESNTITVTTHKTPPTLEHDATNNTFGKGTGEYIELTFTEDTENDWTDWRNSIYGISVEGNVYEFYSKNDTQLQLEISKGSIRISKDVFDAEGDYEIVINAFDYKDAIVQQLIKGPKSDFVIIAYYNGSAMFSFSEPEVDSVTIEHSTDGGENWTTTNLRTTLNSASTSAEAINLEPNKEYYFRLVVVGGDWAGESNIVSLTTESIFKDFKVIEVKSTSATFTFEGLTGATSIILKKFDLSTGTIEDIGVSVDNELVTINDLIPGESYVFWLCVVEGEYDGLSNSILITALAEDPEN